MRWVRSWPAVIPPGRSYVVDELPRLTLADYDYAPLADYTEGVCLIEWDMAASWADLQRFMWRAESDPSRVLVAPYLLYALDGTARWAHRRILRDGVTERWLHANEPACDLFGFGMVYLPPALIRGFLASRRLFPSPRLTDQTFSVWHHQQPDARPVPVDWTVRPVHLHFPRVGC